MWLPRNLLPVSILPTMNTFLLFLAYITPTPVLMRTISIVIHISTLSIAKFECSTCTTSLETFQVLFFLPSKHVALSVDH